jgi:hypothetical protein
MLRACAQFSAHRNARCDGRIGLEPEATRVAHLFMEQDHLAGAPDLAIGEHFNGVLQFMPDEPHEIAVGRA